MSDPGGDLPASDGPAARPPTDRRVLILGVLLVLAVVAIVALLVTRDDGDTSVDETTTSVADDTSTSTSSSESTTSTTGADPEPTTTSTAAPPTTSTTASTPPVTADPLHCREAGSDPTDPESPAQAVVIAWTRGDVACAQELMTPAALADLFGRDGSSAEDVFQGCWESTDGDPHVDCAFTYPGGSTHLRMNFSPTDGWTVFEVYQVAD